MQAKAFLEQHSARLLEIANGASKALLGDTAVTRFLERVHADFETVEDKPGRRDSLPGEDVFWWCITILEELADLRGPALRARPLRRHDARPAPRPWAPGSRTPSRCRRSSRSTGSTSRRTPATERAGAPRGPVSGSRQRQSGTRTGPERLHGRPPRFFPAPLPIDPAYAHAACTFASSAIQNATRSRVSWPSD